MEVKRKNLQGVLNILSFNRHFYVWGVGVLALVIVSHTLFDWPVWAFWLVFGAFLYGLIMPLLVSAYVYDLSGFYNFPWLKDLVRDDQAVNLIVNINAGFDETSFIIKEKFPRSDLQVFDFYDAKRHTEPAIVRARKVSMTYPNTRQIASNSIPVRDGLADIVFLLSAVHEIRSQEEKVRFLTECRRVCRPGGSIIMIEHIRDFPNFLAFSVGFTHFFSRRVWRNAFERAGFSSIRESKFTPFMSIFHCKP